MRWLGLLLAVAGCGGGAGSDPGDAAAADSEMPPTDGGGGDAGPVGVDAGPPPSCDVATASVTLADGFLGDRDGDPEGFVAIGPEGPFAFAWRSASGRMAGRIMRAEALVVDAEGTEVGRAVAGEASGATERLGPIALAPAAGGVFVAWQHDSTGADGAIVDARIHHAGVGADGVVVRPDAVLYDHAAVPVVAADPPDDLWMLRSDLDFVGEMTGVSPQLQHLDGAGDPVSDSVRASSFLAIEATEVSLETTSEGLVLAYRVPPSTVVVVPLDRRGVPARPERRIFDVPFLDDVATAPGAIALAHTETVGGTARLGVVVTDAEGRVRGRATLDEFEADYAARIAVVQAWPGFVAVWRTGAGDATRLRAAGIDTFGNVLVGPLDLARVPHLAGDLHALTDGTLLTIGYRLSPPDTMPALGMTRTCLPGA